MLFRFGQDYCRFVCGCFCCCRILCGKVNEIVVVGVHDWWLSRSLIATAYAPNIQPTVEEKLKKYIYIRLCAGKHVPNEWQPIWRSNPHTINKHTPSSKRSRQRSADQILCISSCGRGFVFEFLRNERWSMYMVNVKSRVSPNIYYQQNVTHKTHALTHTHTHTNR